MSVVEPARGARDVAELERPSPLGRRVVRELMPAPAEFGKDALPSAEAELYRIVVKRRGDQSTAAKDNVESAGKRIAECFAREAAATQREHDKSHESGRGFFESIGKLIGDFVDDVVHLRLGEALAHATENLEEAWNSPRFWSDLEKAAAIVAKGAAVVAAAAATVATLGTAAPVAVVLVGVGLSALSVADGELHMLEACGVDAKTAGWIRVGVGVAGAATTGGASLLAAGGAAPAWANAARIAGVAAGALGGAAQVIQGGAHARNGEFAAAMQEAAADRQLAAQGRARLERSIEGLLRAVKEADASLEHALTGLHEASNTRNDTLLLVGSRA